jgi:hypothetical protein
MNAGNNFVPYRLSDDERKAVCRGLAEMRARRLASDQAVAAVFDRYRSINGTAPTE